eukprot:TRINITY_DN25980_c0_g1_i2.p1 TRINITY_DN25980_c0_g1~~TRINITY_DN25980_c0_g1_i2.p1  ORF type:complete len:251 (+),score=13.80 TRINITY_DN25980_c0_g1_i2:70-822(+)
MIGAMTGTYESDALKMPGNILAGIVNSVPPPFLPQTDGAYERSYPVSCSPWREPALSDHLTTASSRLPSEAGGGFSRFSSKASSTCSSANSSSVRRSRRRRTKGSTGDDSTHERTVVPIYIPGTNRLLSNGSKNHHKGMCRPCYCSSTGAVCPAGMTCNFCHYDHDETKLMECAAFSRKKNVPNDGTAPPILATRVAVTTCTAPFTADDMAGYTSSCKQYSSYSTSPTAVDAPLSVPPMCSTLAGLRLSL